MVAPTESEIRAAIESLTRTSHPPRYVFNNGVWYIDGIAVARPHELHRLSDP